MVSYITSQSCSNLSQDLHTHRRKLHPFLLKSQANGLPTFKRVNWSHFVRVIHAYHKVYEFNFFQMRLNPNQIRKLPEVALEIQRICIKDCHLEKRVIREFQFLSWMHVREMSFHSKKSKLLLFKLKLTYQNLCFQMNCSLKQNGNWN